MRLEDGLRPQHARAWAAHRGKFPPVQAATLPGPQQLWVCRDSGFCLGTRDSSLPHGLCCFKPASHAKPSGSAEKVLVLLGCRGVEQESDGRDCSGPCAWAWESSPLGEPSEAATLPLNFRKAPGGGGGALCPSEGRASAEGRAKSSETATRGKGWDYGTGQSPKEEQSQEEGGLC